MNISWMSRRRATRPLIRYSLCPLRYKRRLTTTSPGLVTLEGFSARFFFFARNPVGSPSVGVSSIAGTANAAPVVIGVTVLSGFSVVSATVIWLSSTELSNTNLAASASSGSSIVIVTSARPIGGRLVVPLKIQSAIRSARRDLWLCSPSTQLIASTTLDLPQPLGPTMQVVPVPLNVTTVRSQKDLKPTISTLRSLSKLSPFVVNFYFASGFPTGSHTITNELGRGFCARRETTNLSSKGG